MNAGRQAHHYICPWLRHVILCGKWKLFILKQLKATWHSVPIADQIMNTGKESQRTFLSTNVGRTNFVSSRDSLLEGSEFICDKRDKYNDNQ
jgi:hypothetical protein